jgi:conjugal transfer mating pair stabilization protein TraN
MFFSRLIVVLLSLTLVCPIQVYSQDYRCFSDLNGDGNFDAAGEMQLCQQNEENLLYCGIGVDCEQNLSGNYTCPNGSQFQCSSQADPLAPPQCFPLTCYDIETLGAVEETEYQNNSQLSDDGIRTSEGVCLAQTKIFPGFSKSCRLSGVVSAFKNCCSENDGQIYHDSTGSSFEDTLTNKAITALASASYAAAVAYGSAISAGATSAQASNAASSAFTNSIQGAFDPTSLAIMIAIALIMEWLANACRQSDIETAMLVQSNYCYQVGTICTHRWFGSCVQREAVHCCFNSMLARIVNEQGMLQLDRYDPNAMVDLENLDCGGFTPEEFQGLDFTRIDFSEYEGVINNNLQDNLELQAPGAVDQYINNVQ